MSSPIAKEYGARIDAFRWAKNGQMPDIRLLNLLCHAQNRVLAYRRKTVFNVWDASYSGSGTTQHRFRFHTGEGVQGFVIEYGIGFASHPSSAPYVTFNVNPAGASGSSVSVYYGQSQNGGISPSSIQWGKRAWIVDPNSAYEVSIVSSGQASIWSVCAYELGYDFVNDEVTGYLDTNSAYGQIDDATRQNLLTYMSDTWKHNGSHLLNWTDNGTAATVTGGTWTNVLDATTAVASTSAGYVLGPDILPPYERRVAPTKAVLCAYGSVSGGAGTGEVRLYTDYGGASPTLCSVTGINGTPGWFTLEQTLGLGNFGVDEFTKADLQFRMNGAGTLSLNAVSLYLYET